MPHSLRLLAAVILITAATSSPTFGQAAVRSQISGERHGSLLEDGTPVKLRIGRTVSSADAHVGETVDFEVLEEIKVGNVVVIPKGGTAWATVTAAESKKRMARGGKLDMNIDSVRLADGEKAALRAVKEMKGGGHTGAMTGGIVATAIVFWPAAPFFLFMHGKDITVPKGTEITAYVNGNFPLDIAKFETSPSPAQLAGASPSPTQADSTSSATLEISSTPSDADIEIDAAFAGNTPSSVGVAAGEHTIRINKKGYTPWERKVHSSSGHVRLVAELEPSVASTPVKVSSPTNSVGEGAVNAPASTTVLGSANTVAPPTVVTQTNPAATSSATPANAIAVPVETEGTVSVSSDPSGADIFVDSVGRGRAPAVLKLKPGKHHIQLVESGYKDSVSEIDVRAGTTVSVVGKLEK